MLIASGRNGPALSPGQPGPGEARPAADGGVPARGETSPLGAVAAGVVHDLRNALTVVLGGLEQLRHQPLDAAGRRQLDRAAWGARHAGRLAHVLLAAGQGRGEDAGTAGGGEAEIIDLNETVSAFVAAIGPTLDGGAVALAAELAPRPLPARLDGGELERALLNLARNAADATAGGAGQVMIRTSGHRANGLGGGPTVEVAVSDTGAGMTPEAARRATEAFFSTKGQGHGTGLGLWMVRRFAEEAGGKVGIETAAGQGTTVTLVLPRAEAE